MTTTPANYETRTIAGKRWSFARYKAAVRVHLVEMEGPHTADRMPALHARESFLCDVDPEQAARAFIRSEPSPPYSATVEATAYRAETCSKGATIALVDYTGKAHRAAKVQSTKEGMQVAVQWAADFALDLGSLELQLLQFFGTTVYQGRKGK